MFPKTVVRSETRRVARIRHIAMRAQAEVLGAPRTDTPRGLRVEALSAPVPTSALYALTPTYAGMSDRSVKRITACPRLSIIPECATVPRVSGRTGPRRTKQQAQAEAPA
jgi:hypothetical protein